MALHSGWRAESESVELCWRALLPHRLTIRLDDEAWATLNRICELTGVSATAFLQGVVQVSDDVWGENGWRHPLEWERSPVRDATVAIVDVARRTDNDRRKRAMDRG